MSAAFPPPPSPDYMHEIAAVVVRTQTSESFEEYANLFSDDVHVTIDGKLIANSKQEWLTIEKGRLGRVDRIAIAYDTASDNVLVIDRFDDRSDIPLSSTAVYDPRRITRAIKYDVGHDHLIHAITILQSGYFLTAAQ